MVAKNNKKYIETKAFENSNPKQNARKSMNGSKDQSIPRQEVPAKSLNQKVNR